MSLIQDALKKAQEEREKGRDSLPDEAYETYGPREGSFFSSKRIIIYSLLFLVVVIAVVFATVLFKPPAQSTMKALRGGGETPVTAERNTVKRQNEAQKNAQTRTTLTPETPDTSDTSAVSGKPATRRETPPVRVKRAEKIERSEKPDITAREVPVKTKEAPPKESRVEQLVKDGDLLRARGDAVLAVERYKEALSMEKRVSLYLKLYSSFRAMKNEVLAGAYIDEGLKDFPDSFALNKIAAIIHIRGREFDKALENIETALTQNKGDYAVFTYRGLCHFHKRDYENALLDFKASLDLDSNAVENYYYIALIYDNVKDYDKALEFYRVFFKLNPETEHFKHREWVIKRIDELERYLRQQPPS